MNSDRIVLAFGSFDILHPGHIKYLDSASKLGDRLVVVVARDESIRMLKHREPFLDQKARLKLVGSLKTVDKVILGNNIRKPSDIYDIFRKCRPDIIALGYDQHANVPAMKKWLKRHGMNPRIVRLRLKLNTKDYKSSKLLAKISNDY